MSVGDDIDMLAAEYVVGTLDSAERRAVAARRSQDAELDAAISEWESRLSGWHSEYQPVDPPAHLRAKIVKAFAKTTIGTVGESDEAKNLRRSVGRWRAAAIGGYAIAASLCAFLIFKEVYVPPGQERFVAVFQNDDKQPAFIMSIDLKTREVIVRAVTAKPASGKTYQMWIASEELGGKPRSLGLIEDPTRPTRKTLPYDPKLLKAATFGISVEPEGGSPTGTPTGRAVHGYLIPTTD